MFNYGNNGYSLSDIAAASGRSNDDNWGNSWWIIIFVLLLARGWGNNNDNETLRRGDLCNEFSFNDLQNGVRNINDSVNTGFSDLNSTICHQQYDTASMINNVQSQMAAGFAGVDNSVCTLGYQNAALINGLQQQISDCCCRTQENIQDVKYNMATNTCALQNTIQTSTRDLLDNQNANTRAILDYLCQDKINSLTAENQNLKFAASQQAQNAYLIEQLGPKVPVAAFNVPNPYAPYGYGNNCGGCNYVA